MTFEEYQKLAMRTAINYDKKNGLFLTAQLSLIGEAGEIIEQFNRLEKGIDTALDTEHLAEELGDVLWGCAFVCNTLNISLDATMRKYMINHTPQNFKQGFDLKLFSAIANEDPIYDKSGMGLYQDNIFMHSCEIVDSFKDFLKIPSIIENTDDFYDKEEQVGMQKDLETLSKNFLQTAVGDVVENISLLANKELGISINDIAEMNILKLEKRYDPQKQVSDIMSNPELYSAMSSAYNLCRLGGSALKWAYPILQKDETPAENKLEIIKDQLLHVKFGLSTFLNERGFTNEELVKILSLDHPFDELPFYLAKEGVSDIRGVIEQSCKMADIVKKAHYKGTEIDQSKLYHHAEACGSHLNEAIANFGLPSDLSKNDELWYNPQ